MNGLVATSLLLLAAGANEPQRIDNYGDALKQARASEKPLLVVIEDADGSAHSIDHSDLLARYVICRVDATTAYGQAVAKAFNTKLVPMTAVIDRTGSKILYRKSGAFSDASWNAMLAKFQEGRIPTPRAVRVVNYQSNTQPQTSSSFDTSFSSSSYGVQPSFGISNPAQCFT